MPLPVDNRSLHADGRRCDSEVQKLVTSMTFEELVVDEKGVSSARALVNVVINQQIGQQISVSDFDHKPPSHLYS